MREKLWIAPVEPQLTLHLPIPTKKGEVGKAPDKRDGGEAVETRVAERANHKRGLLVVPREGDEFFWGADLFMGNNPHLPAVSEWCVIICSCGSGGFTPDAAVKRIKRAWNRGAGGPAPSPPVSSETKECMRAFPTIKHYVVWDLLSDVAPFVQVPDVVCVRNAIASIMHTCGPFDVVVGPGECTECLWADELITSTVACAMQGFVTHVLRLDVKAIHSASKKALEQKLYQSQQLSHDKLMFSKFADVTTDVHASRNAKLTVPWKPYGAQNTCPVASQRWRSRHFVYSQVPQVPHVCVMYDKGKEDTTQMGRSASPPPPPSPPPLPTNDDIPPREGESV